jgi:hypothetical protein
MTSLTLIDCEAQAFRELKAEIEAVKERIKRREAKLTILREREREANRQANDEDWWLTCDRNDLHQLESGKKKSIRPQDSTPEQFEE